MTLTLSYEPLPIYEIFGNCFFQLFSLSTTSTLDFRGEAHKQCGCSFAEVSPNHRNTWPLTGSPLLSLEFASTVSNRQAHYKRSSGTQDRSNIVRNLLVVVSSMRLTVYAARQTPRRHTRLRLDVNPRDV